MKLYLRDNPKPDKFLGEFKTKEEIHDRIDKWLNLHNYHAHYFRVWSKEGKTWIDFGDWHKLFYVVNDDE